jgi:hypothetical protein
MLEAAVELLDAAIVSCPPYCRRRTRPVPMAVEADDPLYGIVQRRAAVSGKADVRMSVQRRG